MHGNVGVKREIQDTAYKCTIDAYVHTGYTIGLEVER